jgi:DNA-binding response OmpR family regulator
MDQRALKAVRMRFDLSPNEGHALVKLAAAAGKPVGSVDLVRGRPIQYGNMDEETMDRLAKVTVAHLRDRLGSHMIKTMWGKGYVATPVCIDAVADACKHIL